MTDIGMVKYAFETEYGDVVDETAKEAIINELDENEFCQNLMKTLLKKYYKYEGKVIFEIDKEAEAEFA